MDKKKITAIVIAGAVLLFIIAVVLFLMMSKKQDPVESLQKALDMQMENYSLPYLKRTMIPGTSKSAAVRRRKKAA